MEYKQIVNYPLYFINKDGNSVIKLCSPERFIKLGDNFYRRKKNSEEFNILLPKERYTEIDGLVYRVLKIAENQFGYKFIKPANESGKHTLYMHRLVYRTFVGAIPSDKEVNHIDHDKSNNSIDNLELVTHSENIKKAVLHYGNKLAPRCKQCGRRIYSKKPNAVYCSKCARTHDKFFYEHRSSFRYEHPSKEVLWVLIKSKSFVEIGRIYGVTDNAIRKLAKKYNLPFRKRDIERQIEKDKNLLLDSHCIGES